MNSEQFTYWLKGYTEICGVAPTSTQWEVIKDHLNEVFKKNTPNRDLYMDNDFDRGLICSSIGTL